MLGRVRLWVGSLVVGEPVYLSRWEMMNLMAEMGWKGVWSGKTFRQRNLIGIRTVCLRHEGESQSESPSWPGYPGGAACLVQDPKTKGRLMMPRGNIQYLLPGLSKGGKHV